MSSIASAWIELHAGLWNNHKLRKLQKELGIPTVQVVGHLVSLWHFVLENAWETGDLAKYGDALIEESARWYGESGQFVTAMRKAGFLDDCKIHDWYDYAGMLVRKRIDYRKNVVATRGPRVPKVSAEKVEITSVDDSFEDFWLVWPEMKQVRKMEARDEWGKLDPSPELQRKIKQAVIEWKLTVQWTKDDGQWIPAPNSWLAGRRWEERAGVKAALPPKPVVLGPWSCDMCKRGDVLRSQDWGGRICAGCAEKEAAVPLPKSMLKPKGGI